MDPIYLDNAASTPVLPEVWQAMEPYLQTHPGNPASSHRFGRHARQGLEQAREVVAQCLDASPEEVIFTSGATEANNLALWGLPGPAPGTLITSPIEHPCVTEPTLRLAERGYVRQVLAVSSEGKVELPASWPDDLRLVAVMLTNHETGAVQPIEALSQGLAGRAPFHCDAAAAAGKMPISFRRLGVTSLTISGHKFHGPAGIGALLLKKGTKLRPLFQGGHQQQGRRPGTEPVFLAVGLAKALELATEQREAQRIAVLEMRRRFLEGLQTQIAPILVNGPEDGIPHVVNVSFPGCRADALLMGLDLAGVACSTGSACSSGSLLPSPVLQAMRVPKETLESAMRFSFSRLTRPAEVEEAVIRIVRVVRRLRESEETGL